MIASPPVPKPIAKGRFTAGFLARLLVEKFVLGWPVHRVAAALAMERLDVPASILAGILADCAPQQAPLAAAITARNAAAGRLHADGPTGKHARHFSSAAAGRRFGL